VIAITVIAILSSIMHPKTTNMVTNMSSSVHCFIITLSLFQHLIVFPYNRFFALK
jgi:hypothetical protein